MSLVKDTLELALKQAFKDGLDVLAAYPGLDAKLNESADKFAKQASTAIDAYIKTATIITPPGQAVIGGVTSSPSLPAVIS
jgi:hypothetical protein